MSPLKDVDTFMASVNIFNSDSGARMIQSALALGIGFGCVLMPAAVLRLDGRVGLDANSFIPLSPQQQSILHPNARLNGLLRFSGAVMGMALGAYAWSAIQAELTALPTRLKKREALDIVETESINSQIIDIVGEEVEEQSQQSTGLPPLLQSIVAGAKQEMAGKAQGTSEEISNNSVAQATNAVKTFQGQGDKWLPFREIGESIINSMMISDKSILITSGTGTGKTTTENEYLKRLCHRSPGITLKALLNKNDTLYGVNPADVSIFKPEWLDLVQAGELSLREILRPLVETYDILQSRKELPASERERLRKEKPVRCILGDWFATYEELKARLTKVDLQRVLAMVRAIITVGRDMGVGLIVDTHSANLEDLGIAASSSIRQSLDIYSQGYITKVEGEDKGELQTIRLIFENGDICSKEERKSIAAAYDLLANAIESKQIDSPIIFTSVGARPRIGIVPRLVPLHQPPSAQWHEVISSLEENYKQAEFYVEKKAVSYQEIPEEVFLTLTPQAQGFITFMQNSQRQKISVRDAYRYFSYRGVKLTAEEMKAVCQELHQKEVGCLSADGMFELY